MKWFVYILLCNDSTLYTGITTDLARRISQHNEGKGAKYTSMRRPIKLVYFIDKPDRSSASKEEYRIKQLTRLQKLNLIKEFQFS